MAKATIQFEKEDIEYLEKKVDRVSRPYIDSLAKGYDIDKALLYHIYDLGYETCKSDVKHGTVKENHD